MTPTYRLDTLAVNLIARLEPSRRAHIDDPARARQTFERIVREAGEALAAECLDTLGDADQAQRIQREAVDTFLPRYCALAVNQNRLESKGFGEGIIQRIILTALAFFAALVASRILHSRIDLVFFALAALTPFAPELRLWWSRRAYRAKLQELSDDMGKIQSADLELARPTPPAIPARRPTQKDLP